MVSRVLVGLTEAVIMTCCTTLLADYFHGSQRERYFGLQVVFTTVAATLFFGVGGALGSHELADAVLAVRGQPPAGGGRGPVDLAAAPQPRGRAPRLPPLPWRTLAAPVGVTLLGGLVFYVLIVELSFKLDDLGVDSDRRHRRDQRHRLAGHRDRRVLFSRLAARGPAVTVPLAFALSGLGLIGLGLAPAVPLVVCLRGGHRARQRPAAAPLLTWALGSLTFEQRGRGTGLWTAAVFLGQFVCPLVVLALSGAIDGLGAALVVVGVVAVAAAVGVRLSRPRRQPSRRSPRTDPEGPLGP